MSKELLVSWLQDAYAMEAALPSMLRAHASHAKGIMPEFVERLRDHAEETELHAERMRQALARVGGQPSIIKSALSAMMGPVQGITTGLFSDALVKDALADLATEQFEVGCYDALIAAAHQLGEVEVAALCLGNRTEDDAMAAWLQEQLPRVVRETLQRVGTATAKR
jgi:ferritin-like metal-binding protein YciE